MFKYGSSFTIAGQVAKKRELKTAKGAKEGEKRTFAYSASIATIGSQVEVEVDEQMFATMIEGDLVIVTGDIGVYGYNAKLLAKSFDTYDQTGKLIMSNGLPIDQVKPAKSNGSQPALTRS